MTPIRCACSKWSVTEERWEAHQDRRLVHLRAKVAELAARVNQLEDEKRVRERIRKVTDYESDPVTGGWLVKLDCGHEKVMEDRGGGIPIRSTCDECSE